MHIPDGFLDAKTAAGTGALAVGGLGFALSRARRVFPPRRIPLLGLAAAFVFAAQMLNFPVAGGTSGHLVGGTLTAALLGPEAAVIVVSAVLIVQCFLFADGGVTALGANVFNMALIDGVLGWAIYHLVSRSIKGLFGRIAAATFAAWVATVAAAIVCAGELAASGTIAWRIAFPAMAGVHMLIGVGEGIITALVLVAVCSNRPELLAPPSDEQRPTKPYLPLMVYGGLIALGLALFVSPFASTAPDGLDKTAERLGFAEHAKTVVRAPMPDYKIGPIGLSSLSTSIAGAVGTLVVFGLALLLARALVPARRATPAGAADAQGTVGPPPAR
jgi:cobalt/nickel transport system permease protein